MDKFSIAIALLMDSLVDAMPPEVNYLELRTYLSGEVKKAMQKTLDIANGKE